MDTYVRHTIKIVNNSQINSYLCLVIFHCFLLSPLSCHFVPAVDRAVFDKRCQVMLPEPLQPPQRIYLPLLDTVNELEGEVFIPTHGEV